MISSCIIRHPSFSAISAAIAGFLLPWQTVWIIRPGMLGGVSWPLATIGVYASDVVLFVFALLGVWRMKQFRIYHKKAAAAGKVWEFDWTVIAAMLALIVTVFLNSWVSVDPWLSAVGWFRIIAFLLAVAGLPYSRETARAFLLGFLIAMGAQAIIGIAQFLMQTIHASTLLGIASHSAWIRGDAVIEVFGGRWLRAYGGFPHPNIFGAALLVAMIVLSVISTGARSMSLDSTRDKLRGEIPDRSEISRHRFALLEMTTWSLFIFALVFSFSRSALLGLLILLFLLARKIETRRLAIVGTATLAVAIALTWPFWVPRATATGYLERRSIGERRVALTDARALSIAHPFFGVGLHAMPTAILRADPTRDPYSAQPVHNVPLLALVELGFIGFALLLLAIAILFRHRQLAIGHWSLVILPPFLFDHALWSLPVGVILVFVIFVAMERKRLVTTGST